MRLYQVSIVAFFLMVMLPNYSYSAYPIYIQNRNYSGFQRNQTIARRTTATLPTRITGKLPMVGSNATAGRQYYEPEQYDRLADSGLYIGISAGYNTAVIGGMNADYKNQEKGFSAPGAFKQANYLTNSSIIPLQLSVGASINNDLRIDFSYTRYSGINYAKNVFTSTGNGGYSNASATGGGITSNVTNINIYYNIDSYTGNLAGGSLRPYIGIGLGLSLNTISDYIVKDPTFYSENDPKLVSQGKLTGISNVEAYHNGGTSEQLSYTLEGGVSTELKGGMKADFFLRYIDLGIVTTSGSIIVKQTEWIADGNGNEVESPYASVFHWTNWQESGKLGSVEIGARMRLQF